MPSRPSLAGSPEPGIPLLPTSSSHESDVYGELESSASAEVPTARSRAGARGRSGLGRLDALMGGWGVAGGEGSSSWRRAGWLPLLGVFVFGLVGGWLLPAVFSPSFAPDDVPLPSGAAASAAAPAAVSASSAATVSSPASTAIPASMEDTLMNPWTRPGIIRNRPVLPVELAVQMGETREGNPWKVFNAVRWEPDPADDIHPDYGQGGESLMEQLADAADRDEAPEGWDWARGKTILGIGDSLMRNNVDYFSKHISDLKIGRKVYPLASPDGTPWQETQYMFTIDVPHLDMKVANWFHMGMVEHDTPGFWDGLNKPQRFEDKLEQIFLPTVNDTRGLNGRVPDLIIFESLSWDLVFLTRLARNGGDKRYEGRPLDEIELEWARGRQVEVLRLLRKTFPTSKIVVQTPHLGSKSPDHVFSPIRKFQQAEIVKSLALETGFELFDWGRIVSPLSSELRDGLHFVAGCATWLWGEMVLSYLRRAHYHPVNIPPAPDPKARKYTQADVEGSYKVQEKIQYPVNAGVNDKVG